MASEPPVRPVSGSSDSDSETANERPIRAGSLRAQRPPKVSWWRRIAPWLIGLAALVGIALALSTRFLAPDAPELTLEIDGRVAVLPLQNQGPRADDWTIWGLTAAMAEAIEATDGVFVVAPEALFNTLRSRRLNLSQKEDRARARELAAAHGAEVIVDLSLRRGQGQDVVMEVDVLDPDGRIRGRLDIAQPELMDAASQVVIALADALGSGRAPVALTNALSLDPFADRLYAEGLSQWVLQSPEVARPYFEIALRGRPAFVQAQLKLIDCRRRAGELETAQQAALKVLERSQSRGNRAFQARAFRSLGLINALSGDSVAAAEQFKQALRLDERRGDIRGQALSLSEHARVALADGNNETALSLFRKVLELYRQGGDRLGQIDVLMRIGSLLLSEDQPVEAERVFTNAMEVASGLRDVWNENRVAASLGEVAWRQGDSAGAVDFWQRALAFYQRQGDEARALLLSRNLAKALIDNGDFAAAEARYQDQLDMAKAQKRPRLEAEATVKLAWLQLRQGYPFQARPLVNRAVELDRHLTDRADLQRVIAWLAYEEGNYQLAANTQADLRRQSQDAWTQVDAAFLATYVNARRQGRRLPLPGESAS